MRGWRPRRRRTRARRNVCRVDHERRKRTRARRCASTTSRTSTGETTSTSWFAALGRGYRSSPCPSPAVPPTSPRRSPPCVRPNAPSPSIEIPVHVPIETHGALREVGNRSLPRGRVFDFGSDGLRFRPPRRRYSCSAMKSPGQFAPAVTRANARSALPRSPTASSRRYNA